MWPVLLMLLLSRGGVLGLDQLLLDDLDLGISMGGWQDVPPMPAAHELILLPSALQFPRTDLANIASHAVTLYNNHHNKTVYLNSVFALPLPDGQHNDFHVPFVREQAVPPQGNFTFTVVFLPTQIGAVHTEILMRTSFGQLKYQVQGLGVASPFKVLPLTQLVSYAGVNSNAAIIPDITLYNPYDLPIQITEIFSSGGKFYLELPTRERSKEGAAKAEDPDARTQLWTIAAFEKRPVIRVRFVGSLVAGNYSAYIRMKVICPDDDQLEDIILVIPIRMEVRALQPISLYPEKSIIDLGSVLLHEKRPLSINLFTSDTPDVGVTSLAWDSQVAVGEATTRFRRILDCSDIVVGEELHVRLKIECDLQWTEVIRNISQRWHFLPGSVMHISGGITVNSTVGPQKSSQLHRIPLFAEVISGTGLELPRNVTVVYPRNDEASVGIFYLRNNFDSPLVVTGIELVARDKGSDVEAHPVFKVIVQYLRSAAASDFPKVLQPGESWTMAPTDLAVESVPVSGPLRSFVAHLQIATNVTDDVIHVPLFGYSGRLSRLVLSAEVRNVVAKAKGATASAFDESKMVADEEASLIDFGAVRLDVEVHKYIALLNDNPMPVELTKWDMPAMDITISIFHVGCMNKFDLATNKEATMQPDDWCVFSFAAKTTRAGEFNGTFRYETHHERSELPIRVRGTAGTLTLDSSSKVMNCIPKTICITDIIVESSYSETVQLHDIVTYKEAGVHIFTKEILPNTANKIGRMYFNPRVSKLEPRGYTNGYPSEIFDNTDTKTLFLLQRTATSIYRMLQERQFVLPFQVNTDKQMLSSSAAVDFVWPRLISLRDSLRERVVMVGQELVYNISLLNPSHESIAYWYYFTDDRMRILDLFDTPLPYSNEPIYHLLGTRVLSTAGDRGAQKFVLPPGKFHNITIHVSGKSEAGVYASMLVLKNNFTFFEGSWQTVKIVQPQFKFGNRKPFSTTPLLFEIQDQPNVCTGGGAGPEVVHGQQPAQAVVSTRRVFTAKNTGQLPLNIVGISINSEACAGYGFVVLNCDPFVLAPNATHKVEISFVPDFTVSRIDRKIDFHTDVVDFGIQYTLVGVVPQTMLEGCRSLLVGRPWWEAGFKKWALSILATMALIVGTVAYFESLKILNDHSEATYRQRGPFQAPLDFKKLAAVKTGNSSSGGTGGGGGQDVATKDMTKAPKKKTLPPSTLFDSKRFSWFINRSQQQQPVATAHVHSSSSSGSSSSSSSSSAAGQTGQGGVTSASAASNDKRSTIKSATKNTERIVLATKSTDSKGAAEAAITKKPTAAGGAKKETATGGKKNRGKGKSTAAQASRPAESEATVTKVEPKVNNEKRPPEIADPPPVVEVESVQPKGSVEKGGQGPSTLSLDILTAQQQYATEQTLYSRTDTTSPVSSTYGKTPGRERKEKQLVTTSKRNPAPGRASKVPLFQQMPSNSHANHLAPMTDPWTNACRGLFAADPTASDPRSAANLLPYALENRFEERVVPNLNFNELPRDVSGLNAAAIHNGHAGSMPAHEVNGFPENPLGAIGTIPPVSKNYSLFDTENRNPIMQQAGYGNGLLNQATGSHYYNNGHSLPHMGGDYRGNNYPMSDPVMNNGAAYGYGNNNMDMFESQPRSSQDLYVEYQYQKQELQRLALLLAINQAQTSSEAQAMPQNTHNLSDMNGYMGWDQQSLLQQQQQHQLEQQQQLRDLQSSRQQFNGRTGGPPPGMGPRRTDGGVEPNAEDASNQYDPFRSIWNQWKSD